MKKILLVLGTRPEAIKLAPVIFALEKNSEADVLVCVFRQHGAMLREFLAAFDIKPDFDLPITVSDKDLFSSEVGLARKLFSLFMSGTGVLKYFALLKRERPDLLVVQGDTSTVFLAAFLGFMFRIPIAHVEAGLRTYDKYAPFPEEMNRQLLGRLADLHFAPTETARKNLLREGVSENRIHVVGNTEIDSAMQVADRMKKPECKERIEKKLKNEYGLEIDETKKIVLVTAHRRESFGEGLRNICEALKELGETRDDVMIVYPVHPNPNVRNIAYRILEGAQNVFLTASMAHEPFIFLMSRSYFILTDSGGIQESAPALGKPVLVMREKTERQEGVEAGVAKLVGTRKDVIVAAAHQLLDDPKAYAAMTGAPNLYGDGTASKKIADALGDYFREAKL